VAGESERDWLKTSIAATTRPPVMTRSQEDTLETSWKVPSLPLAWSSSWSVGMKAAVIEPSARRRRKRFGAMFAVVKADITSPAPKIASCSESRTSPSTRETDRQERDDPDVLEALRHEGLGRPAYGIFRCSVLPSIVTAPSLVQALARSSGPGAKENLAQDRSLHERDVLHRAAPDIDGVRHEDERRAVLLEGSLGLHDHRAHEP
jgi:hypothetical protein